MGKSFTFTETVFTTLEPERATRAADECLVDIRIVEFQKVKSVWLYEYEVKGEFGNVEKLRVRIKRMETVKSSH